MKISTIGQGFLVAGLFISCLVWAGNEERQLLLQRSPTGSSPINIQRIAEKQLCEVAIDYAASQQDEQNKKQLFESAKTYAGQAANPEARGIRPWLGRHKKKLIVGGVVVTSLAAAGTVGYLAYLMQANGQKLEDGCAQAEASCSALQVASQAAEAACSAMAVASQECVQRLDAFTGMFNHSTVKDDLCAAAKIYCPIKLPG